MFSGGWDGGQPSSNWFASGYSDGFLDPFFEPHRLPPQANTISPVVHPWFTGSQQPIGSNNPGHSNQFVNHLKEYGHSQHEHNNNFYTNTNINSLGIEPQFASSSNGTHNQYKQATFIFEDPSSSYNRRGTQLPPQSMQTGTLDPDALDPSPNDPGLPPDSLLKDNGQSSDTPSSKEDEGMAVDENETPDKSDDTHMDRYVLLLRQQRELMLRIDGASPAPADSTNMEGSTWAEQNPGKPVQPVRPRNNRSKTDAQRKSDRIRSNTMAENAKELENEIKLLHAFQDRLVKEMVRKYKKTERELRTLVFSKPILKSRRAPNLRNALLHKKAVELNDSRPEGERLSLVEIQESCDIKEELELLTEEQREELRHELAAYRELKQTGARASNASAAQDMRQTMDRIGTELKNLSQRVGCVSFLFTTRGHVQDHTIPGFVLTGNAVDFFPDVLNMPQWDLLRKFEQWVCAHDPTSHRVDSFQSMRVECTKLISEGLRKITNPDPIMMNYINYDMQVVQKRHVKLMGWPDAVSFIPPSNMTCVDDVRSLLHALRTKKCQWVRLSTSEAIEHMEGIQRRKAAGEEVGRKRKEHSDKGKKRKGRHTQELEEEEQSNCSSSQGNKAVNGKHRRRITSKAVVLTSSDEDEE